MIVLLLQSALSQSALVRISQDRGLKLVQLHAEFRPSAPVFALLKAEEFNISIRYNSKDGRDNTHITFRRSNRSYTAFANALQSAFGLQIVPQNTVLQYEDGLLYAVNPAQLTCRDQLQAIARTFPCKGQDGLLTLLTEDMSSQYDLRLRFRDGRLSAHFRVRIAAKMLARVFFSQCPQYSVQRLTVYLKGGAREIPLFKQVSLPSEVLSQDFEESPPPKQKESRLLVSLDRFQGYLTHKIASAPNDLISFCERFPPGFQPDLGRVVTSQPLQISVVAGKDKAVCFRGVAEAQITTTIFFQKRLLPFERYQLLGSGGEELSPGPVRVGKEVYFSQVVVGKTLEPDFSMPFKVIGSVLGLVVYYWINTWRALNNLLEQN